MRFSRPDDWSDLLSPILVKEFRQGVRGNVFTGAFLLLHGLMLLTMAVSLIDPDPHVVLFFFWMLLSISVGAFVPLSGLAAISDEKELKTLEPLLLTHLSPRAIVSGKWASLAVQNLILGVSVAPYLLLRYFMGGLDFGFEAWAALDLTLTAGVIAALSVAFSALRLSAIFRRLGGLVASVPLAVLLHLLFQPGRHGIAAAGLAGPLVGVGLALVTIVLMMEAGAWQIAPAADRSSAVGRLVTILWLLLAALALFHLASTPGLPLDLQRPAGIWTSLIVGGVVIASLCEPQSTIVAAYARFFGRGAIRRAAGWILAPGWAAGVVFAVVVVGGASAAVWATHREAVDGREIVSVLAALLFPVPFLRAIPRLRAPVVYIVAQLASFGLGAISPFAELMDAHGIAVAAAWLLPLSPILRLVMRSEQPALVPDALDWTGWAVSVAVVLVTFALATRELRATERRVIESRRAPVAPAETAPASAVDAA